MLIRTSSKNRSLTRGMENSLRKFGNSLLSRAQPTGSGEFVRRMVVSRVINARCTEEGTVVDFGAGDGNLWGRLRPDLRAHYVVVDMIPGRFGLRVIGSVTAAPIGGNTMSFVCLSDVLEHIVNDFEAVAEAARVLRPNGYLVIHVPSMRAKPYRFLQRVADAAEAAEHHDFPHVRDGYTTEGLRKMLASVPDLAVVSIGPSFHRAQSLISDLDTFLWWYHLTPLRSITWLAIRLSALDRRTPSDMTSSGHVAILQKKVALGE
jgi:SAM-dependent methyltransferase